MEKIKVVSLKMIKEGEIEVSNKKIGTPGDAAEIIKNFIGDRDREHSVVITLDTKNQITSISINSIGSLNSAIMHPREIFKTAVLHNSASIIIGHNHPSGDCTPSQEDINISHRICESGKVLGIELIDHIIVGDINYISLKEKGVI